MFQFFLVLFMTAALSVRAAPDSFRLDSPSGRHQFKIRLASGVPVYSVLFDGQPILRDSRLGLQLANGSNLGSGYQAITVSPVSVIDATWRPVYGERSTIHDRYRSQTFHLAQTDGRPHDVSIEVRCYDEGVAFCYHIDPHDQTAAFTIEREQTEFCFPDDHITWAGERAQGPYRKTTITGMGAGGGSRTFERPQILFDSNRRLYVALAEARMIDYARMQLVTAKGRDLTLGLRLAGPVHWTGALTTPWRVIMAADSPGRLLEHNDLILNLNDPCNIQDTSWIRPGTVLREVTLSTEGALACVDFASSLGIEYVHFDAGWYGHEYDDQSDATTVTVDPRRSNGPLDLHRIIQYASERGVGILLYVNRRALETQLDDLLPLYRSWGVAGIKFGFVQVGTQAWTTWLHEAVRKAADYQLMVDVHDEYRPTGFSRTYPNLMTQEGIAGDETQPSAEKTLGILFGRGLAGASDNTICYYSPYVTEKVNHAFQLAKAICMYSPLQFVFWYDRPSTVAPPPDATEPMHRIIGAEPELEFFGHLPTVWDDTRILAGSIESYVVVARRSGKNWYIGAMNAGRPRSFDIALDFLDERTSYGMRSYTHDPQVSTSTRVHILDQAVTADTVLTIPLQENDGAAYRITPGP